MSAKLIPHEDLLRELYDNACKQEEDFAVEISFEEFCEETLFELAA